MGFHMKNFFLGTKKFKLQPSRHVSFPSSVPLRRIKKFRHAGCWNNITLSKYFETTRHVLNGEFPRSSCRSHVKRDRSLEH